MELVHIFILLATGIVVGFAGGLLGLGGAFIMTPVQYIVFTDMGLPVDIAIKLAFGTNLLVVLPTAVSGAWRHHQRGAVRWRAAFIMGGCSLVFAFAGATIAAHIPGLALKITYGVIALISGIRMLIDRQPEVAPEPVDNPWLWTAWAIPVGLASGIFGIGGAIIMVPVLVIALKFEMHNAIATSLGVMILTSVGGIIGYIVHGVGVVGLPPYSIGYINLPSWVLLAVPSVATAQVGAVVAHKTPAQPLKYIFAVIIFYMGLKMIGLFDWLGWPI